MSRTISPVVRFSGPYVDPDERLCFAETARQMARIARLDSRGVVAVATNDIFDQRSKLAAMLALELGYATDPRLSALQSVDVSEIARRASDRVAQLPTPRDLTDREIESVLAEYAARLRK